MIKHIKNKRGSYIVEGAMTLPFFIVAVISLALIIRIISVCEGITFSVTKEFRTLSIEKGITRRTTIPQARIYTKVLKDNFRLRNFQIKYFNDSYSENGIEDMLMIKTRSRLRVNHPLGIDGKIAFDFNFIARNYTGKKEEGKPLGEEAFKENADSHKVIIFPKYGIRFHRENCFYVTKKYKNEGNKTEMEREDAIRRGYSPCKVCGG